MKTVWSHLLLGFATLFVVVNATMAQGPPGLTPSLLPGPSIGLTMTGTVGRVYIIQTTTDLTQSNLWSTVSFVQLPSNNFMFVDNTTPLPDHKFYRGAQQTPPTNMVFIPPGTFTLGSPTNEAGRSSSEGPQTIVTITHGFWMGRHPVTQGEYLSVIGTNPSGFPGDLSRPVETVSWLDATNYCGKLTQQELAAGHIPAGTRYRLPTEAEWEYAARAGTTTRYYYGDDPGATQLSNHAWYANNSGAMTHPVEQKPPNPFGLFDMEGNVWELCQDWFGAYPGGSVTDPQGPASNPLGNKVMRGGAWDAFDTDCRSASRNTFAVSPFITDTIVGFRVVLSTN